MSELLKSLVGTRVKVYSGEDGTYQDDGILEAVDEQVIVLRNNGQALVFPIANIRLIKPIA